MEGTRAAGRRPFMPDSALNRRSEALGGWKANNASFGHQIIPRTLYIPSLEMYAEANDTGATSQWAQTDAGLSDYGTQGVGRVDVYNLAGGRSSSQVEHDFANWVGGNEFGQIYVVSRETVGKRESGDTKIQHEKSYPANNYTSLRRGLFVC